MKPINSVKSSRICFDAGIHVAMVRTFSETEVNVTAFSALALASTCGEAMAMGAFTLTKSTTCIVVGRIQEITNRQHLTGFGRDPGDAVDLQDAGRGDANCTRRDGGLSPHQFPDVFAFERDHSAATAILHQTVHAVIGLQNFEHAGLWNLGGLALGQFDIDGISLRLQSGDFGLSLFEHGAKGLLFFGSIVEVAGELVFQLCELLFERFH